MSTTTKLVRKAIIARLQTMNGAAGGYTYTLAAARQVMGGRYPTPPGVVPFACVWTMEVGEEDGPPLTNKQQQGTFMVQCWVPGTVKDSEGRQDAAEDMLDDVRSCLRGDRLLGGLLVLPMRISGAPIDGAATQGPDRQSHAQTLLSITAVWRE